MGYLYYKAINWNETEDALDQKTWEQLTNNFWLDIRVPITQDKPAFDALDQATKDRLGQTLASASLLAAYQSEIGTPRLRAHRRTQQEEALINIITFMQSVHTKAYTTIFRGLVSDDTAEAYDRWADADVALQAQVTALQAAASGPLAQAAFVLTETTLLFDRLQTAMAIPGLPNVSAMLQNILSGSLLFVNYFSYKWQQALAAQTPAERATSLQAAQALAQTLADAEHAWLEASGTANADSEACLQFAQQHAAGLLGLAPVPTPNRETPLMALVDRTLTRVLTHQPEQLVDEDATEAMVASDYDF